jgi:hypothetical protein
MVGLNAPNTDAVADGDEAVRTLIVLRNTPRCGQLNITNSTLPSERLSVLKETVVLVLTTLIVSS